MVLDVFDVDSSSSVTLILRVFTLRQSTEKNTL